MAVSISRVTVEGDWAANVCNDNLYGILVEGGAALNLAASVVENVGADPLTSAGGCQGGVGVEAGNSYTSQVGHVLLDHDTVRGYQKNGITADGAGSTAFIANSTVTGAGATPYIAQNGIQISTGATGADHREHHLRQQLHRHRRSVIHRRPGLRRRLDVQRRRPAVRAGAQHRHLR